MKKSVIVMSTAVLIAAGAACSQSPGSPSTKAAASAATSSATQSVASEGKVVVNDLTGVSLGTPTPSSPNDGQTFKYAEQPITLVVKNAVTTGAAPTYTFQLAADSTFASPIVNQEGVAQGTGGTTSVVLPKLAGSKTYVWRARATSSGTVGLFSTPRSFSVGPEVVLQAPVPASPGTGASVSGNINLVVNNVQRSGPVTAITYRFDLGDSSSFAHVLASGTAAEQGGAGATTAFAPNLTLGAGTYYWRVQAFDNASGVSSPVSSVISFSYQPFNMSQATVVDSPTDLATWAETARITSVIFTPDAMLVDFDKRDGPDRWPDTPFGDGSIEYSLGICVNITNHWYCAAPIQFWYGRDLGASGIPSHVGFEWFYPPAWGPMSNYQPQEGETVGVFVCAGNCRHHPDGDNSYVKERSNVQFVPWSNDGNGSYTFSNGSRVVLSRKK